MSLRGEWNTDLPVVRFPVNQVGSWSNFPCLLKIRIENKSLSVETKGMRIMLHENKNSYFTVWGCME